MNRWDKFLDTFFNAKVMAKYLPDILSGVVLTIELAIAVVISGLVAGLVLALVRSLGIRPLNWLIIFVVDLFRSLPPLVVIVLIYFGLPSAGLSASAFVSTWLSLALVLMAFAEEIFWAGITSTPKGQWEASRSTGLSFVQTLLHVVLPQALRLTIAPLTNRTIAITLALKKVSRNLSQRFMAFCRAECSEGPHARPAARSWPAPDPSLRSG